VPHTPRLRGFLWWVLLWVRLRASDDNARNIALAGGEGVSLIASISAGSKRSLAVTHQQAHPRSSDEMRPVGGPQLERRAIEAAKEYRKPGRSGRR